MRVHHLLLTLILAVASSRVLAAEACWDVVMPQPYDYVSKQAIKINKCTGETWMLLPTLGKSGQVTSDTWVPIETQKPAARSSDKR